MWRHKLKTWRSRAVARRLSRRHDAAMPATAELFDSGGIACRADDIEHHRYLNFDRIGTYLAILDDRLVFADTEGKHKLTEGPTGSGKGSMVVQPRLALPGSNGAGTGVSLIVVDVDSENRRVSEAHRRDTLGQRCWSWRPFGEDGHRFNVLQPVINAMQEGDVGMAREYARAKGLMVYPSMDGGANQWITDGARRLAQRGVFGLAYRDPASCTLSGLFRLLSLPPAQLLHALVDLSPDDDLWMSGYLARMTHMLKHSPKQFGWVHDAAVEGVEVYAPGTKLAAATDASDFDLRTFKKEPQTLYWELPGDQLESAAATIANALDSAIEMCAMAEGEGSVEFMIDEVCNLPRISALPRAMRLYRKRNVCVHLISQGRQALAQVYGVDGARDMEQQCAFIQYLQVPEDIEVLRELEVIGGYRTATTVTTTSNSAAEPVGMTSAAIQRVPNLWAADARLLDPTEQLIRIPGMKLVRAQRVPWWQIDPWKDQLKTFSELALE